MSKKTSALIITILLIVLTLSEFSTLVGASFSSFSFDYSSARSSFRGALSAGNNTDSSLAIIQTTPSAGVYSLSSAQLLPADLIQIGFGNYFVATNSALTVPSEIPLDRPLTATDTPTGTQVLMRQNNNLSFSFKTSQNLPNGSLQVLIPAASNSAQTADNLPDSGGFDFASSGVICPNSIAGVFDFLTPTASPASTNSIDVSGQKFHVYTCPYVGSGIAGADFSDNPLQINGLLNPAPSLNHQSGAVEISQITFRQTDDAGVSQDAITAQIGFFEPVRVTVDVAPQISFQITGVSAQNIACGINTDSATFSREVPFEDISPLFFKNAAQRFTISTNAAHGYTVTAVADDQMGLNGGSCAGQDAIGNPNCIPDVTAGGATPLLPGIWNDPLTQKGFGYSLQNLTSGANPTLFDYTQGYKQFADRSFPESPVAILRNQTAANNDEAFICYRIVPPTETNPGAYESNIMYTITATF